MSVLTAALFHVFLHSLWQCALLALAAALALRAMREAGAGWRHVVAMVFLIGMALVPVAQLLIYWQADAPALPAPWPALLGVLPAAPGSGAMGSTGIVAALWASGVLVMLARLAAAAGAVARLERAPHDPLPQPLQQQLDRLGRALGVTRGVTLRLSDEVFGPCATSLRRPVIWWPTALLARTPGAQVEALLSHELAHIARRDWLWNTVQRTVETLLFFHPAVWWLGRRIRRDRELACDQLAVASGADAIALAEALAGLESARRTLPRPALAAAGGSLVQRVTHLLGGAAPRSRWGILEALGAMTVLAVLIAAQTAVGGGRPPALLYSSSTTGALGPGDHVEIAAHRDGRRRSYRASMDSRGDLTEVYREDGKVVALDAEVREWVAGVARGDPSVAGTAHPGSSDRP